MNGIPQFKLPLYSTSSKAAEAVGSKFAVHIDSLFKTVHVLWERNDRRREKYSPVIVETDRGQIELSSEDEQGIGIAFDSISRTGTDGRGVDVAASGYEWGPLDIYEFNDVAIDQPIVAIRLIGEELKGVEFDLGSKRVRGRIQIWSGIEDCDHAYGLSVAWVQPLLEGERRRVVGENKDAIEFVFD